MNEHPRRHFFHLVDASPWPLIASVCAWVVALNLVGFMHHLWIHPTATLLTSIILLGTVMALWWRDVVRESTHLGYHTLIVQTLLRQGIVLFIVSEIMFFFSFFFAYFSSALSPTHQIAGCWPPVWTSRPELIEDKSPFIIDPFMIPLSNTLILLLSGLTVTWAHHAILEGDREESIYGLICTICLGILFTLFQLYEYVYLNFQINDSIFGTTFYMTTGFHGFHVLIGTLFLSVMLYRHIKHHFSVEHHVGLEGAIWYWHFVDVVWILLYISMYLWPAV